MSAACRVLSADVMVRNEGQRRDRAGKFLTAHDEGKLGALIGEIGLHIAKGDRRVQAGCETTGGNPADRPVISTVDFRAGASRGATVELYADELSRGTLLEHRAHRCSPEKIPIGLAAS